MYLIDTSKILIEALLKIEKSWEDYFRSNRMCQTNHISNLLAVVPSRIHSEQTSSRINISMKRSDGELFTVSASLESDYDTNKVKELINHLEELRTCSCTKDSVCSKHSSLQKI